MPLAWAMLRDTCCARSRYRGSSSTVRTALPTAAGVGVALLMRRPTPDQETRPATSGLSSWPLLVTMGTPYRRAYWTPP